METKNQEEIKAVADMAMVGEIQERLGALHVPAVALPRDFEIKSLDGFQQRPPHIVQTERLGNIVDFCEYVNEHKQDESRIFWKEAGDRGLAQMRCSFSYHGNNQKDERPSWNCHHAELMLSHSDEYRALVRHCGTKLSHRSFLEFIEDYGSIIQKPDSGKLMDLVRDLKATKTVEFKAKQDLDTNDVELQFSKKTGAERGDLVMPAKMTVALPILKGGNNLMFEVRVKYDVDDGGALWIRQEFVKHDMILTAALDNALEQIKDQTEVIMYEVTGDGHTDQQRVVSAVNNNYPNSYGQQVR